MRIFWSVIVCVLMSVTGLVAWAALSTPDTPPEPSRDALQRYLVIGYPMSVPHGFRSDIDRWTYKPPNPQPWIIDTYDRKIRTNMVYPDMRMDEVNDYDKDGVKTKGVIRVTVDPVPGIGTTYSADEMKEEFEKGNCTASKFGDVCPHYYSYYKNKQEAIYLGSGYDFVFCDIDDGHQPVPHCEMDLFIIDDIRIDFFFDRRLLGDVLAIRDRVFARVCSWITWPSGKGANPAGKPLKVNHCR